MAKKRSSHNLKLLQGTARSKGQLESRPPPPTGRWNCPNWLGADGKAFHKRYWGMVETMGRLSECDRAAWFNLCQRWSRIRQYEREIDEHGALIEGRQGSIVKNPLLTALKGELEHFRKERAIFGLDPESRELIGFKFASPTDKYQRYLDKKAGKTRMEDLID